MAEVVYTADSQLRNPLRLLRDMGHDLLASRELAWRLFVRDVSGQYRQSLLGYVWVLVPPLVSMAVWVFLESQNLLQVGPTNVPYPLFVLTGLVLWEGFVAALVTPQLIVQSAAPMLTKINFPREALLLSALGQVLFNTAIRLVLLALAYVWLQTPVPVTAWLAPFGFLAVLMFGFALGVLLVPLGMLYGDIARAVGLVTPLWFFLTPVVYPPSTTWPSNLLNWVNPVSPMLITARELLTTGTISYPLPFAIITAATLCLLLVSWTTYRVAMPHIIARLSA